VLFATTDTQWRRIAAQAVPAPALKAVIVLSREEPPEATPGVPVLTLAQWLAQAASARPVLPDPPRADELAALVYTSGTTFAPAVERLYAR
jgi:long-chain acyl-CoA synthetase